MLSSAGKTWKKNGDYKSSQIGELVSYVLDINLVVDSISISRPFSGDIYISITSKSSYPILLERLEKGKEFPLVDPIDKILKKYTLVINNIAFLKSFLVVLKNIEPGIEYFQDDIIVGVSAILKNPITIPGWTREKGSGFSGKAITYKKITINKIVEIVIKDKTLTIELATLKDFSIDALKIYQYPQNSHAKISDNQFRFEIMNNKHLERVLNILIEFDHTVSIVAPDIRLIYNRKWPKPSFTTSQMAFLMGFHPRVGDESPLLTSFKNEKHFEMGLINCIFAYLPEAIEQPEPVQLEPSPIENQLPVEDPPGINDDVPRLPNGWPMSPFAF